MGPFYRGEKQAYTNNNKIERIYVPIAVKLLNGGSGRHFFYLYLQNSYLSSSSRNQSPPYQNSVFQSNIFCHPNSQNFNTTLRTRYRGNSYLMYNLLVITPSWFFPIFFCSPKICPMSIALEAGKNLTGA